MKLIAIFFMAVFLQSCTMDAGEQTDESKRKTTRCVDTRDGEAFIFKNNTLKNARVGIGADSCFDITDTTGKERRLCQSMELYLKCSNIK